MKKIIQIQLTKNDGIIALCEDGSLWNGIVREEVKTRRVENSANATMIQHSIVYKNVTWTEILIDKQTNS